MVLEIVSNFKIVIIGDSNVGKTSLLLRYTDDKFDDHVTATVGVHFKTKVVKVDTLTVNLDIWDTAGSERYRSLTHSFYRNVQGAIVVYDVSSRTTFDNLQFWLDELDNYGSKAKVVKMIVGNKIDREHREVKQTEGIEFAKRHQALYVESTAKKRDGVDCAFEELVHKIVETPGLWEASHTRTLPVSLSEEGVRKEHTCGDWSCSVN